MQHSSRGTSALGGRGDRGIACRGAGAAPRLALRSAPTAPARAAPSAATRRGARHRPSAASPSSSSSADAPGATPQPLALRSARQALLALLDAPAGAGGAAAAPDAAAVSAALEALMRENPSLTPGLDTPEIGVGVWEVFHAPHITRMSGALGTRFDPIRYSLAPGGGFSSNVKFSNAALGRGWLSASGSLAAQDELSVKVTFKDFWVDLGDTLRPALGRGGSAPPPWADALIEAAGRALFLPQLSVFPVLYLDADLAVFQFPPLSSNIAVRRVAGGGGAQAGGARD
ncbi:MAG: hypothetical protein J3K34DRAFT_21350 [Monoraphidium minutum]|nr:MAG: hypothetical protein J3K34DRAFT_21350 [Monoraphidium minutum]